MDLRKESKLEGSVSLNQDDTLKKIHDKLINSPDLLKELDNETRFKLLRAMLRYSSYSGADPSVNYEKIIDLIVEYGTDMKLLEIAFIRGDVESAESLLKNGANLHGS